uniref:Uncharacterized protein n=1 Tax=Trichogramma kaykai TaxID=54128 RepID=A0ABD2WA40_9HYME
MFSKLPCTASCTAVKSRSNGSTLSSKLHAIIAGPRFKLHVTSDNQCFDVLLLLHPVHPQNLVIVSSGGGVIKEVTRRAHDVAVRANDLMFSVLTYIIHYNNCTHTLRSISNVERELFCSWTEVSACRVTRTLHDSRARQATTLHIDTTNSMKHKRRVSVKRLLYRRGIIEHTLGTLQRLSITQKIKTYDYRTPYTI